MSEAQAQQEKLRAAMHMALNGRQSVVEPETRPKQSPRPGGPKHPIQSMQGPFEESIQEASNPPDTRSQDAFNRLGPKQRRQKLIDTDSTNGTYNAQWRSNNQGSRFHPLTKIISQIAFGVHLLHQQLAKSDEEVVKILQKHVDDVDNFVQRCEEDLDLAIADIRERIGYLKLPLEHPEVFDVMLDDKKFRTSILDGNEKIEKVVNRTANYVKDLQVDQQKGMESTIEMGQYLDDIAEDWPEDDQGSVEIYRTMQANVEGWMQCMSTLQIKGNGLSVAIVQLGSILNEMAKRAGSASRREQRRAERAANPDKHSSCSSKPRASSQHRASQKVTSKYSQKCKPLPDNPDLVAQAVESTLPDAKLPMRERLARQKSHGELSRKKSFDPPRKTPSAPSTPSLPSVAKPKAASMKSSKGKRESKKPPPIKVEPNHHEPKKDSTSGTARQRIADLASVFRFHGSGSAAPSPLASPTTQTMAESPFMTPLASPGLPQEPPPLPQIEVESGGAPIHELDNEAQSALIQARSRLRQHQSQEYLNTKHFQQSPDPSIDGATDSAYASSPELEQQRPLTAPAPNTVPRKPIGGFLTSPSVMSLRSTAGSEDGDKESYTALPQVTSPTSSQVKEPSPLRGTSMPGSLPTLKKRSSLTALKRFFSRGRSASAEPRARRKVEEHECSETVAAKKKALEDVFELPG